MAYLYNKFFTISGFWNYEYFDNGKKFRVKVHDNDSVVLGWWEYEYYPFDSVKYVSHIVKNKLIEYQYYEYGQFGMTLLSIHSGDSSIIVRSEFRYNSEGRMAEQMVVGNVGGEKRVGRSKYTYDSQGNPLEVKTCSNKFLSSNMSPDTCWTDTKYFYRDKQ